MTAAIQTERPARGDGKFVPIPDSPQEEALASEADITIMGGANGGGKTAYVVGAAARGIDDPGWYAALFRSTYPELRRTLIKQSQKFYPNASDHYKSNNKVWEFPSGAEVDFSYLQHEDDKKAWDGAEITLLGFDQLEDFSQSQFTYLLGRLRSPDSKYEPRCVASCNPTGKDHWLYDFIKWWLDEDGYADPDKAGVTRYFHRNGDDIQWVDGPGVLSDEGLEPMSVKFVPATVDDNPHLGDDYKRQLASLDDVDKQQKWFGRWGVSRNDSPLASHAIQRVDEVPDDAGIPVRYWDLADTDASADSAEQASHTAGVRGVGLQRQWTMCQHADQETRESCSYWTQGEPESDTCPKCGHDTLDTRQRDVLLITHAAWFQLEADAKENRICAVASQDGQDTHIGFEQEGGQSGKDNVRKWKRRLLADYTVEGDRPTGDKRSRMKLWLAMAKRGRLWVLDTPRMQDYVDALVDMEPMDVVDATSGVAKMALDDDRVDGPTSVYLGSIDY